MAAARPLVNVYDATTGETSGQTELPGVFTAPIRRDVVHFVHTNMAKNSRQAYAVKYQAGHDHSAESWGTGRAVARIPRVSGSGTHRAGQGAFGNMCRSGRMFAPTKVWRKWHRKIPVNQRRYATVSALAASAIPALVMARGHRIDGVDEVPLVLSNTSGIAKTKVATQVLARFGAFADVQKVMDSKKLRRGVGKMRNRRFVQRRGPLIIHADDESTLVRAFRNLPGVDSCRVSSLNLLQLAPGGHMGRFCIWTEAAFASLNSIYGTSSAKSTEKSGYSLPTPSMSNADLGRLINSEEIQAVVRPAIKATKYITHKKNPLKNFGAMVKLNPYAMTHRRSEILSAEKRAAAKAAKVAAIRK